MDQEVKDFIRFKVEKMRETILKSCDDFKLDKLLVNPYLSSALFGDPNDFIKEALHTSIFKSMQTKFGNLLEEISIKACKIGIKSPSDGIDVDYSVVGLRLLISIKSGLTWGNTQSTKKQGDQFKKAKQTINQNDTNNEIISVMGICCGNKKTTDTLSYADWQIVGQNYWYLLTQNLNFYEDIIEETSFGVSEFQLILKNKLDETFNRLIDEFKNEYYVDNMSGNIVDTWRLVVRKSCGNFSENDFLIKKIWIKNEI